MTERESLLSELSLDDAIDGNELNKYHLAQLLIIYSINIFYVSVNQFLNLILPALEKEFSLNNFEKSFVGAVEYFGIFIGSITVHSFADKYGRRKTYLTSIAIFILFQALTTFSSSFYTFCFLRCLQSIAATFLMLLAYILVVEFLPKKYRGFLSKFFSVLAILGNTFCISIVMITYDDLISINWRKFTYVFIVCTSILLIVAFFVVGESVRYDLFKGDKNRGFNNLNKLRGGKGEIEGETRMRLEVWLSNFDRELKKNLEVNEDDGKRSTFFKLMRGEYKKVTLILIYTWFATTSSSYGIEFILPIFLQKMSIKTNLEGQHPLNKLLLSNLYNVPLLLLMIYFTEFEYIGRKKSLSFFFFLLFASNFLLSLELWPGLLFWLTIIKLCLAACFMIVYVYTVELFPTYLRMAALGACSGFSRIGQMMSPWMSIYMMDFYIFSPFIVLGIIALIASLMILQLPYETKNKKMESLV